MEQPVAIKDRPIVIMPKTAISIIGTVLGAYIWMFATFVSAGDFRRHEQTYELDRTDDKIDTFEIHVFNITESMRGVGNTVERREQLSKYEGTLRDYRRQQTCLEAGGTNCRRKK